MSAISVDSEMVGEHAVYFTLSAGKTGGFVGYEFADGRVHVLCKNASHHVWRGCGRFFRNFAEAKAAYKSADMKAMIEYAERSPLIERK